MNGFTISITAAERGHAEWALDPMMDIPDAEDWYTDADLPLVFKTELVFPSVSMAVDDLLYRLEEQLADMADQEGKRYPRAAGTLAQKIRDTAGVAGWRATMGRGWRELEAAS